MRDGLGKLRGHRPQEIGVGCSLPARQSTLARAITSAVCKARSPSDRDVDIVKAVLRD
jgi:hypothetical protein